MKLIAVLNNWTDDKCLYRKLVPIKLDLKKQAVLLHDGPLPCWFYFDTHILSRDGCLTYRFDASHPFSPSPSFPKRYVQVFPVTFSQWLYAKIFGRLPTKVTL